MCSLMLAIFVVFVGLKLTLCADHEEDYQIINKYYSEHIYKIHPLLVIIGPESQKSLVLPDKLDPNGIPKLTDNQQLYLYCCGYNNRIATSEAEKIDITTTPSHSMKLYKSFWKTYIKFPHGQFLKHIYQKAYCLSPMLATQNLPGKKCGFNDKGIVLEAGFKIGSFMKLYSICFNEKFMSAIYTMHKLIGSELLFPQNMETWIIPNKNLAKIYKNMAIGSPYFPDVQEMMFLRIFGPEQGQVYLNIRDANGLLYTAAPLTPPGDFYFPPHKTATNVYENTLPVFNKIFVSDCHIVGELGRLLAYQVQSKKLLVITGAYHKLKLWFRNKEYRPIDLDTDEINKKRTRPIPKFIYKVYYDADSKKGIAFVTLNNPYKKFKVNYFPCRHIGTKFINIDYFSTDGILRNTVYCKVDDLMKRVKDIPPLDVSNGNLYLNIYDKTLPIQRQLPPGIHDNGVEYNNMF